MLLLEDLAAVKVAVELCNGPELREEILNTQEMSDRYKIISKYKEPWDKNIENKTSVLLENLGLGTCLKEKVLGFVLLLGTRMLTWAAYHERFLDIPRDFIINDLRNSLFTSRGVIDSKNSAEELMKCQRLSIKQRYKLACLCYFADQIPDLFKRMSRKDQKNFYNAQDPENIKQPRPIKLWSYLIHGCADQLRGEQSLDEYLLETATKSSSKAAVEYCLKRATVNINEATLFDAAIRTIKNRIRQEDALGPHPIGSLNDHYDYIAHCLALFSEPWVPDDFFTDMLYLLYDKMTVAQQIEFLSHDFAEDGFQGDPLEPLSPRVLRSFLNCPYQNYFMRTANLVWNFLPEQSFASLLSDICSKIESEFKKGALDYGEGKTYNYRNLLKNFWRESPKRFKRHFFSTGKPATAKAEHFRGKDLIFKLFSFTVITNTDMRNIEMILESATDEETREISSLFEISLCRKMMKKANWRWLNFFASIFYPSLDQQQKFKRDFIFLRGVQSDLIEFVRDEKYDSAQSIITWSAISEKEIVVLKREMINSNFGTEIYKDLLLENGPKSAKPFCTWFVSTEEEFKEFKASLISSQKAEKICHKWALEFKFKMVDEFINWCIFDEEAQREFKSYFACQQAHDIFCKLIAEYSLGPKAQHQHFGLNFSKPIWEQVEMFLTWCFSSAPEVKEFKEEFVYSEEAEQMCNIYSSEFRFKMIDEFISWGISDKEKQKEYKRNYADRQARNLCLQFISHYFSPRNKEQKQCRVLVSVPYYAEKEQKQFRGLNLSEPVWEQIEMFLTWCFSSEEEIIEMKKTFFVDVKTSAILIGFIYDNDFDQAEAFFSWLLLSCNEIKELKKKTLFASMYKIVELVHERKRKKFLGYAGGKWENLKVLLKWSLTDREAILEFKDLFEEIYGLKMFENQRPLLEPLRKNLKNKKADVDRFYLLIEALLFECDEKSAEEKIKLIVN